MKTPENINELIAKFFAGEEMTSLEKEQFQEWKKENNAEASQQISISIGQVRESADVNQVMEALTAKLREAHLSGARKARGG